MEMEIWEEHGLPTSRLRVDSTSWNKYFGCNSDDISTKASCSSTSICSSVVPSLRAVLTNPSIALFAQSLKGINPEVSDLEVDKLGENELFLKYLFLG
jgi:hypothetical protein